MQCSATSRTESSRRLRRQPRRLRGRPAATPVAEAGAARLVAPQARNRERREARRLRLAHTDLTHGPVEKPPAPVVKHSPGTSGIKVFFNHYLTRMRFHLVGSKQCVHAL